MRGRAVGALLGVALAVLGGCSPEGPVEPSPAKTATVHVQLASATALPSSISYVVLWVKEGAAAARTVTLTIAENRLSAGGSVSVQPGPVQLQVFARNSSSTDIFASMLISATLADGESTTLNTFLACVHSSCEGGGGGGATVMPTVIVPIPEVEPNGTLASAHALPHVSWLGKSFALVSGVVSSSTDLDFFSVSVASGATVYAATIGDRTGIAGSVDTELHVYGPSGSAVTNNDQCSVGGTNDSCLNFTAASSGLYRFRVRGYSGGTGRYSLVIEF